ncbi:hypothetical protein BH10PSE16_BH10PSE16_01000 [soil metagenome]
MKFSSFRRQVYVRPLVSLPRPVRQVAPTVFTDLVRVQAKDDAIRCELYLRLVAAMPCKACGIQGHSQAAHLPPEGKCIKQDDRLTFALCCVRMDVPGCHADYDQYRMFTRLIAMTVGRAWAADTRRQIIAAGQWPPKLPFYPLNDDLPHVGQAQLAIETGAST